MGPKRKVEAIMAKVYWKGSTLLAPVSPTMVTCGSWEKPNIITIAWTGIVNSQPPMTYISVRPSRYSYELLKETGEFVINLTPAQLVRQADWCGVRSGRDVDKFQELHLTKEKADHVKAPMIGESPVNIECKVKKIEKLGSHHMFLAEVVAVHADEAYMDKNNKFQLNQSKLMVYSHGEYLGLGKKLGTFGYSVKKGKKHNQKLKNHPLKNRTQ